MADSYHQSTNSIFELLTSAGFRRLVLLFCFPGERLRRESRKSSEERFGQCFFLFGWKFQVLLHFGFHVLKFFGGGDFREALEKHLVGALSFHHFESIEHLAMRRSFPNRKN